MNFLLHTYGCQMNERDSEAVASLLIEHGHVPAASEAEADLVIVNTCTVRGKAEDKAVGKLGLLTASARARPGMVVGVIGCAVQRMGATVFEKVRGLDFALGPHRLERLPEILDLVSRGRSGILDVGGPNAGDRLAGHLSSGPSAFVTVLHGCDRHCAYCIVPSVRGPERSRPGADIVAEVSALAASGVREITLLGQSVMSYGLRNPAWPEDHVSPRGYIEPLPRLLEAVAAVPGVRRLRFTSGHPSGCTAELARAMSELPAVCEHLHLPLQSGSDRILRLMNRGYDSAGYRAAVRLLRERVPGIALTTDVIVGFPSEAAAEFEATRSLLDEIGFDNAFIFKYSPRSGTPAAKRDDDVPAAEKARRNGILLEDQDVRGLEINNSRVGKVLEVMAEGPSRRNPLKWAGRTRSNVIALFDPPAGLRAGDMADILIERAMPQTLYGNVAGGDR